MFENLTSINVYLVSVRQPKRRNATGAQGVCCHVQKEPNAGLIQADSRVILSLLVCALLEIRLPVQMEAIVHTKTLRSNFHPYSYPL